jgi:hypothetical protein
MTAFQNWMPGGILSRDIGLCVDIRQLGSAEPKDEGV